MIKNAVAVRDVVLGLGRPKICVSLLGSTQEEIMDMADGFLESPADLAEWRLDRFRKVTDPVAVCGVLEKLRAVLLNRPLLATFRRVKEGGETELSLEGYLALYRAVLRSQTVDLIDLELSIGEEAIKAMVLAAHAAGVKVIISAHDVQKTPKQVELVAILKKMQELGADIPKLAVMATCPKDVLTLLCATEEMNAKFSDRPLITVSMSKQGKVSRLSGELFGSTVTFGIGKSISPKEREKALALGQLDVEELFFALKAFGI